MLKDTQALYDIVSTVRKAVTPEQEVSAKIRLGFDDKSKAIENAIAIAEAGASQLVVHARTKVEGYKPPAYWDWIAKIKQQIAIPVIANGEIWTADDAKQCMFEAQTDQLMLGRGALATPNLALSIKLHQNAMQWHEILTLLHHYSGYEIFGDKGRYFPNRIKQWLGYLKVQYEQADILFEKIKTLRTSDEIVACLSRQ